MMNFHFFNNVLISVFFFRISKSQSCIDKQKAMKMPKGLKGIPVVLMLAQIGKDVRLPCHYCNQNPGITGRVWRRRTLHGRQKAVSLDMHDDPKKNRVFTTQDHSLVIRRVRPQDGAYYFCYDIEDKSGSAKIDILLDVTRRSVLEAQVIRMPVDFNKEIPKWLKSCQNIRKFKALSRYKCYAEWGPWSKCDACGKVGQRKRIGECRLQKFVKAQMETEGKTVKADFPIVGVGCHSVLLDVIPVAKKILYKIPNLVMIEKCEVSCKGYVTKPSKMKVFMRSSFLRKMAVKIKKKLKSVSPTVSVETKQGREGTYLTLFCPGANIDTRVKWKYNERTLNPDKVREKTGGRITIDATDALHIKELRVTDAGEYICTLYDVEIGIIRLKVSAQHAVFDPRTNFGILTLTLLFSFILWAVLVTIKWKNFKMQQKVQKMRNQTQDKDVPEKQSLLNPTNLAT